MMLDDKGAVKAERFGLDIVFDEVAKSLAAIELGAATPRRSTPEQAKLHRPSFLQLRKPETTLRATRRCSKYRLLITGIPHGHDGECDSLSQPAEWLTGEGQVRPAASSRASRRWPVLSPAPYRGPAATAALQ